MNYKLETRGGDVFQNVSKKAKEIAVNKNVSVEFDFNGITCVVDYETNTEWLYRDYSNSWTMGWKTVGPNCLPEYPQEVQAELNRKNKESKEKSDKEYEEYRARESKERADFEETVKGVELELKDESGWVKSREVNADGYGKAALDYAEGWAKLMQVEMSKGRSLVECADYTQKGVSFLGITGFQYGAAVATLTQCWKYCEELREWHNKEYDYNGDGVVNPAVLTIRQ